MVRSIIVKLALFMLCASVLYAPRPTTEEQHGRRSHQRRMQYLQRKETTRGPKALRSPGSVSPKQTMDAYKASLEEFGYSDHSEDEGENIGAAATSR